MVESIMDHIADLLAADPLIYAGGSSWAAGFTGVRRPAIGDTAEVGYVNIFDTPYEPGAVDQRPAIYVGDVGEEARDQRDGPGAVGNTEFRLIRLPLVIAVLDTSPVQARKKKNQLRFNIWKVLKPHEIENGYWYYMWYDVDTAFQRDTGGGEGGAVHRIGKVYLNIQYTRTASGNQA